MEYKTSASGGVDCRGCSLIQGAWRSLQNAPYWYRMNNGIRTREQAEQIREYYNKNDLPPYGEAEVETTTQALTPTPEGSQAVGHTAPNLSVFLSRFEFFAKNSLCRFSSSLHRFYSFFSCSLLQTSIIIAIGNLFQ